MREDIQQCLCGAKSIHHQILVGDFKIEFCDACGCGRTNPRMRFDYTKLDEPDDLQDYTTDVIEKRVKKCNKRVRFVKRATLGRRLLDVGCNLGLFMEAARRSGFDVEGIEPAKPLAEKARQIFKHVVQSAPLEEISFPENKTFDVITMWHVFEHLENPFDCLIKVRKWLNDVGILIIEVPNSASVDMRFLGEEWGKLQPFHHWWHFNPKAITLLLNRAGFRVNKVTFSSSPYIRNKLRRYPVVGLFRDLASVFFAGENLRVVATRQ